MCLPERRMNREQMHKVNDFVRKHSGRTHKTSGVPCLEQSSGVSWSGQVTLHHTVQDCPSRYLVGWLPPRWSEEELAYERERVDWSSKAGSPQRSVPVKERMTKDHYLMTIKLRQPWTELPYILSLHFQMTWKLNYDCSVHHNLLIVNERQLTRFVLQDVDKIVIKKYQPKSRCKKDFRGW